MKKYAPKELVNATISPNQKAENEKHQKRELTSTRVIMYLSLADLTLTAVPYAVQLYPTLFLAGNNLLSTPVTYLFATINGLKPAVNFCIFWRLIPSYRRVIKKLLKSLFAEE